MTNEEKRRLAVAREIELLRETVKSFDQVVLEAQNLARECRESLARFESIQAEDERLDQAIDALDQLTGRGKYADTLTQANRNANPQFRAMVALCDNVFPIK